jgi:hypothetical protein
MEVTALPLEPPPPQAAIRDATMPTDNSLDAWGTMMNVSLFNDKYSLALIGT